MQYKLKDYHFGQKPSFSTFGDPCFVERERRWTVSWRPVSAPLPVRNCFKTKSRDVFRVTVCLVYKVKLTSHSPKTKELVLSQCTSQKYESMWSKNKYHERSACLRWVLFFSRSLLEPDLVRCTVPVNKACGVHSGDAYSVVHWLLQLVTSSRQQVLTLVQDKEFNSRWLSPLLV